MSSYDIRIKAAILGAVVQKQRGRLLKQDHVQAMPFIRIVRSKVVGGHSTG